MKRTELILVIICLTLLILKGVGYAGGSELFGIMTYALGIFYLVGSFKLFRPTNTTPKIIPILTGISLATSLFTIPFNIQLRNLEWLQILPFINIIFTTFLIGLVGVRYIRKSMIEYIYKSILLRTSIVLIITCFFAFRLPGNSFYRNTIIFLNKGNDDMISNMRAFDLGERTDEQLELGNCDQAIELALLSFKEGLNWLWIDGDSLTNKDIKQLWKIQTTYTNVYRAYSCKADKLYDSKNYTEAHYYQHMADSFLNINPVAKNDWWRNERADSKNKIGLCYDRLNMDDSAATYFAMAIQYHVDSIRKFNTNLSTYLNNLAKSLSNGRYWNEANQAAKQSIKVLDKDSISEDKSDNYSESYLQLVYNSLAENNLSEAINNLSKVEQYLNPKRECKYHLYKSALESKLDNTAQALFHAKKARDCFIKKYGEQYQNVAESNSLLFKAWMGIPNYDSAFASILEGKKITRINHGSQSVWFYDYVKREAYYDYTVGNYDGSSKKLLKVKKVYEDNLGIDNYKLPEILATIGRIKIEQMSFNEGKNYALESIRIAKLNDLFIDVSASRPLNDIAYINYAINKNVVADTLYRKIIEMNVKANMDSSLSVASALNGLGLLSMKKNEHTKADSLFNKSLQLYRLKYPDLHPDIGIILMNQSELSIKRKDYFNALKLVNLALENFIPFHRNQHPTIGDMYSLKALALMNTGEQLQAKQIYLQALEIYESNFQPEHLKIRETRRKLGL